MLGKGLVTIGNALEDSPGITVQQTTYGQVSPVLRGLTGYQVLNLVDGVRYNNSIFRSGPNQYLAFIEPSQVETVEAVLGPSGAQYGSDSLGGTINNLSMPARFGAGGGFERHGEAHLSGTSADLAGEGSAKLSISNERVSWLVGGAARRINDLRSGDGEDSRNVFRRFFDLPFGQVRDLIGPRLQDTGFSQFGLHTKLLVQPTDEQNLTFRYQASDLDGVRQYRNLFGGRGRLQSSFEPQSLQFFYARYEKFSVGALDSVSGTFSINSQRDGVTRQNERLTDNVINERSDVDVFGYAAQASAHFANSHVLVFGGEAYDEHIDSTRFDTDPVTGNTRRRRALYPNGSRYTTYGLFAENTAHLMDGRLRLVLGGRLTSVRVKTFADRDAFGVIDSSRSFADFTFNSGLTWNIDRTWRMNFLVGRGFRAPNMNDLGAIGLNSLGFEMPASEAARLGAVIGSSSGEDAVSVGEEVEALEAESLYSYELGLTYDGDRFYGRVQLFDSEMDDPIGRRTLLFPTERVPEMLAGFQTVSIPQTPEQQAQGVVAVGTEADPLAIKAFVNDGRTRYYGLEGIVRFRPAPRWTIESNYSFLVGRDLDPNRNVRRLMPQHGALTLRYSPSSPLWLEVTTRFAGPQERLSSGDITDARIGAARGRSDIARVFNGGLLHRWVEAGIDGVGGTADDTFTPTRETLLEVQDRVLPLGSTINGVRITSDQTRVPMFLRTDAWFSADFRSGWSLGEDTTLYLGVSNLFDSNYRSHGTGVDAPGIGAFVGLRYGF